VGGSAATLADLVALFTTHIGERAELLEKQTKNSMGQKARVGTFPRFCWVQGHSFVRLCWFWLACRWFLQHEYSLPKGTSNEGVDPPCTFRYHTRTFALCGKPRSAESSSHFFFRSISMLFPAADIAPRLRSSFKLRICWTALCVLS